MMRYPLGNCRILVRSFNATRNSESDVRSNLMVLGYHMMHVLVDLYSQRDNMRGSNDRQLQGLDRVP